ncbi:hypothetical protein FQN54_004757 [Arachnomyces sp. PD_36]|nr:hypothetical protein FQN54_004757 [Arachnomyces sp. PD_36]
MLRISLAVAAFAAAQTANAWTFLWTDAKGESSIEWGGDTKGCQPIQHGEGEHFSWDPKDGGLCILMYDSGDCKGKVIGRSCPVWAKDSSVDIKGFQVVDSDYEKSESTSSTTTEAPTSTSTSESTTLTTVVTTTTSEPTATDPSDSKETADATSEPTATPAPEEGGLSGGAVAGVAIGVIAIIAIIGLIAWILFRRHQRNSNRPKSLGPSAFAGATRAVKIPSMPAEPPYPPKSAGGGSAYGPDSPSALKWGAPSSPYDYEPPPAPYTTRPPPGTNLVELSDTSQLVELDGGHR